MKRAGGIVGLMPTPLPRYVSMHRTHIGKRQFAARTNAEKLAATMAQQKGKGLPQTLTLDHVSPATRLLEKRRQMFEVQEALNAQKEDFARREEAFRRREEGLRQKDLELQESLIKFNKFLQENESKRNRAEKRTRDENRQAIEKEKEYSAEHGSVK